MDDFAINVEHVSKKYCKSLKHSMFYGLEDIGRNTIGLKSRSEQLRDHEFWALDDISFELNKGEALGIIGPNGSGKSTLLKLLNGVFWPDKGKITIKGKVGSLIEVGAGFHPMLTGRENIYINGAILGMTKEEINKNLDNIINFAEIGDFLDVPVKHYSSGMYIRLGFSIAIYSIPDILLIDEILAVGDKNFQIKCYQKMNEIKKSGTTIVLVAHNEYTIREHTEKCLYINHGRKKFFGTSDEAINIYLRDVLEHETINVQKADNSRIINSTAKKAEILSVNFYDKSGNEISYMESGEELNITMAFSILEKNLHKPIFSINFYDKTGFMYCANSYYDNIQFDQISGYGKLKIKIPNFYLPQNNYLCSAIIADENVDNLLDWHDMKYKIAIGRARECRGSYKLPTIWELIK